MAIVNILVEGFVDRMVASKIIESTGHQIGTVYGEGGFGYVKRKIQGFNGFAKGSPLLTLVDLMDTKIDCPVTLINEWLPDRHPHYIFRAVVREIESWLLADRENVAEFLQMNLKYIPSEVESLEDPKRTFINLARRSKSRKLRSEIVPAQGSTATEGILYAASVGRFIQERWSIESACRNAPSLARCVRRLENF